MGTTTPLELSRQHSTPALAHNSRVGRQKGHHPALGYSVSMHEFVVADHLPTSYSQRAGLPQQAQVAFAPQQTHHHHVRGRPVAHTVATYAYANNNNGGSVHSPRGARYLRNSTPTPSLSASATAAMGIAEHPMSDPSLQYTPHRQSGIMNTAQGGGGGGVGGGWGERSAHLSMRQRSLSLSAGDHYPGPGPAHSPSYAARSPSSAALGLSLLSTQPQVSFSFWMDGVCHENLPRPIWLGFRSPPFHV